MNTPQNALLQGPVRMEEVHFRGSPPENEEMISYAVKLLVEKILLDPEKGRVSLEEFVKTTNDQVEFEKKALEGAIRFLERVIERVKKSDRRKVGQVAKWHGYDESGVSMSKLPKLSDDELIGTVYSNDVFSLHSSEHKHGHSSTKSLNIGDTVIAGGDSSVDHASNYLVSEGEVKTVVSATTYKKFLEVLEQKISEGLIRDRRSEKFPVSSEGQPQEVDEDLAEEENE